MQHGSVIGLVECTECGSECTDTGIAIDLKIENFDGERVAGLRAFHKEWASQGIVAFYHAERVAGLSEDVAEAIERIGIENIAGLEMGDWFGGGEEVLYVDVRGSVVDGGLGESWSDE